MPGSITSPLRRVPRQPRHPPAARARWHPRAARVSPPSSPDFGDTVTPPAAPCLGFPTLAVPEVHAWHRPGGFGAGRNACPFFHPIASCWVTSGSGRRHRGGDSTVTAWGQRGRGRRRGCSQQRVPGMGTAMGTGTGTAMAPQPPAAPSSLPSLPFRSAGQGHKEAKSSFLSRRIKPVEGGIFFYIFFSLPAYFYFFSPPV